MRFCLPLNKIVGSLTDCPRPTSNHSLAPGVVSLKLEKTALSLLSVAANGAGCACRACGGWHLRTEHAFKRPRPAAGGPRRLQQHPPGAAEALLGWFAAWIP